MWWLALLIHTSFAQEFAAPINPPAPDVTEKIVNTRASISEDERRQREALSHLFLINKKVKDIAHKQEQLNQKLLSQEASVRATVQEVQQLETRAEQHKGMLNKRLRQLYQERSQDDFHWLFTAQSPVELERNHRFLRRMIDSDHKQLKVYIDALRDLQAKKGELKTLVTRLALMQKQAQSQEQELTAQMHEKSKLIADLKKSKDVKLHQLKGLRDQQKDHLGDMSYAFFEKKGVMHPPADLPVAREYGTFVDPNFHFRLTHKGLFYSAARPSEVHAVFQGKVVYAGKLPGYGRTVIIDHCDNYYSVYAFASQLKVREGARVRDGELVAFTGASSPLFGPGLYFEIRHFTDAIDPRPWIKDSVIKTAAAAPEK
jgi:murein hydrolase activator